MTWTLIDTPSPEELAWGYTHASQFSAEPAPTQSGESGEVRRYFVTFFAIFGLLVCFQNLVANQVADGQRRLAEVKLSERKTECQSCQRTITLSTEPGL